MLALALSTLFLALGGISLYLSICRVERERMAEDSKLHARITKLRLDMAASFETHADKSSLDL
jgi:hypothetical protein